MARICCDDMRMALASELIELDGPRGTVFFSKVYVKDSYSGMTQRKDVKVQIALCPWCGAKQPSRLPDLPLQIHRI